MAETPAPLPSEASRAAAAPVQLFTDLTQQPNLELHTVDATPTAFDIQHAMAEGSINASTGVMQDIHGVIHAGQELFGVVKASVLDPRKPQSGPVEKYMLTLFGAEGERAEVVGVLEQGYPITVGRHHQKGLKSSVSRDHFMIGLNNDGELVMQDLDSKFGTELTTAFTDNRHAQKNNILNDFRRWAPESREVKMAALSTRDGLYVEPEQPQASNQPGLISEVPKDAAEARQLLNQTEAQRQAVREEQLVARERELMAELDKLAEPFSEDDRRNLWAYAAARMNKADAQKAGNGGASIGYEQEAGRAVMSMSSAAKEVSGHYLQLMQALDRLRR